MCTFTLFGLLASEKTLQRTSRGLYETDRNGHYCVGVLPHCAHEQSIRCIIPVITRRCYIRSVILCPDFCNSMSTVTKSQANSYDAECVTVCRCASVICSSYGPITQARERESERDAHWRHQREQRIDSVRWIVR